MNHRHSFPWATFLHRDAARLTATAVLAVTLTAGGLGAALAATAASAPEAASASSSATSASLAAGGQVTVKPGQSLNDIAIAATQSHDRATLVRASRALFDANPSAFMSHDPSKLRLGAVLTVPALDATGAAASAATATASSAEAASAATNAASAAGGATGAAQTGAASTGAASPGTAGTASVTSPASATNAGTLAANPGLPEAASATTGSSAAATNGAALPTSAPVAGSQAAAPASGAHSWSGSVQAASESATGAAAGQGASQPRQVSSLQQLLALKNRVLMELQKHGIGGTPAGTASTASTSGVQSAAGASSAAAVSGHPGAATSTASNAGISQSGLSVAAAVGAALVVLLAALRMRRRKRDDTAASEAATDGSAPTGTPGAAIGSQDAVAARVGHPAEESQNIHGGAGALADAETSATNADATEHEAQIGRAALDQADADHAPTGNATAEHLAAGQDAAERRQAEQAEQAEADGVIAERAAADQAMAARPAINEPHAEHAQASAPQAAAPQAAAPQAAAPQAAAPQAAAPQAAAPQADPLAAQSESPDSLQHHDYPASAPEHLGTWHDAARGESPEPVPLAHHDHHDDLSSETTAASLAAAAELGADALPQTSLAPLTPFDEPSFEPADLPHSLHWDDESLDDALAEPPEPPEPSALPLSIATGGLLAHEQGDATASLIDFSQEPVEPHAIAPFIPPPMVAPPIDAHADTAVAPAAPAAPAGIPRETLDALNAFGSLDMPLPPRVESFADNVQAPASLTTQPVASPDSTAQQAIALHDPDDAPHIADEIAAGTAGHASVAGLGAGVGTGLGGALGTSGFGALKLDFDLDLPPSRSQPLPAFTQAELARIARNKLDLAAEYIELGDLSGARTLINEVIEANDPATRTEARALLSTLAPLS